MYFKDKFVKIKPVFSCSSSKTQAHFIRVYQINVCNGEPVLSSLCSKINFEQAVNMHYSSKMCVGNE